MAVGLGNALAMNTRPLAPALPAALHAAGGEPRHVSRYCQCPKQVVLRGKSLVPFIGGYWVSDKLSRYHQARIKRMHVYSYAPWLTRFVNRRSGCYRSLWQLRSCPILVN